MSDATDGVAPAGDAPETSSSSEESQQDQPRLVPETDLDSLKSTLQGQISTLQTTLESSRTEASERIQQAEDRAFEADMRHEVDPERRSELQVQRTGARANAREAELQSKIQEKDALLNQLGRSQAAQDAAKLYDLPDELIPSIYNLASPDEMKEQARVLKQHIDAAANTASPTTAGPVKEDLDFDSGTGGGGGASTLPSDDTDLQNSGKVFEGFRRSRERAAQG